MNVHKHMEAIFVVTLVVTGAGKFALDSLPSPKSVKPMPMAQNTATPAAKLVAAPAPAKRA